MIIWLFVWLQLCLCLVVKLHSVFCRCGWRNWHLCLFCDEFQPYVTLNEAQVLILEVAITSDIYSSPVSDKKTMKLTAKHYWPWLVLQRSGLLSILGIFFCFGRRLCYSYELMTICMNLNKQAWTNKQVIKPAGTNSHGIPVCLWVSERKGDWVTETDVSFQVGCPRTCCRCTKQESHILDHHQENQLVAALLLWTRLVYVRPSVCVFVRKASRQKSQFVKRFISMHY